MSLVHADPSCSEIEEACARKCKEFKQKPSATCVAQGKIAHM